MSVIRVVWGTGTGPTPTASYDAALAAANVHQFNLITVSSVIPADAHVEAVGTAPDLGEVGDALTVVQGRATAEPGEPAVAGVGWARSESGEGIFYEDSGTEEAAVREAIERGLDAGADLRDWPPVAEDAVVVAADPDPEAHVTAVVLAAYGRGRSLLR